MVRYGTKNCLVVRMTDEACIEIMSSPELIDMQERGLPLQVNKSVNTGLEFCKF